MPGTSSALHAQPVPVVDGHDGRPAAAAQALDRPERVLAVLARRAGRHAELALERLEHLLRAGERAGDVRAHLDHAPPDGLEVVLVVEGRDREAVGGRELERVGDLADRVGREPAAVVLLREPQRGHDRRQRVGYCLRSFCDLRADGSSVGVSHDRVERAADRDEVGDRGSPCTIVAVACSAAKLGARNFTRHGRAPPSETR